MTGERWIDEKTTTWPLISLFDKSNHLQMDFWVPDYSRPFMAKRKQIRPWEKLCFSPNLDFQSTEFCISISRLSAKPKIDWWCNLDKKHKIKSCWKGAVNFLLTFVATCIFAGACEEYNLLEQRFKTAHICEWWCYLLNTGLVVIG